MGWTNKTLVLFRCHWRARRLRALHYSFCRHRILPRRTRYHRRPPPQRPHHFCRNGVHFLPRRRFLPLTLLHPHLFPSRRRRQRIRKWDPQSPSYSRSNNNDHPIWRFNLRLRPFRPIHDLRFRAYYHWMRIAIHSLNNIWPLDVDRVSSARGFRYRTRIASPRYIRPSSRRTYGSFVRYRYDIMFVPHPAPLLPSSSIS